MNFCVYLSLDILESQQNQLTKEQGISMFGGSWDLISEKKARDNGEGTITGQKLKFKLNSVTNKKGAKNCGRKGRWEAHL